MKTLFIFVLTVLSLNALALEDATKGKPFFRWVWEDQFKPTFKKSVDSTGQKMIVAGVASSVLVHQYDNKLLRYNDEGHFKLLSKSTAHSFSDAGNGVLSVGIAATQIFLDEENGLRHLRTIILTSASSQGISFFARRTRPHNGTGNQAWPSSFPSGHTANAFGSAGALAYAYGYKVGIPAYAVATTIALSRYRQDRHFASDIIAGAFIGTFWARAAYRADEDKNSVAFVPSPVYDGMMVTMLKSW